MAAGIRAGVWHGSEGGKKYILIKQRTIREKKGPLGIKNIMKYKFNRRIEVQLGKFYERHKQTNRRKIGEKK